MKTYFSYFLYSTLFAIIALIACYYIGGWKAVIIGATLGILEISLSFDNAVVNASVLTNMNAIWRKRFLFWGILIAVFGARLLIPILIISITSGLNPLTVLNTAIFNPSMYAELIEHIHIFVSGFGSAFLGMVFLKFFFDENKEHHWIHWIEKYMKKIGVIESVQSLIMLMITALFSTLLIDSVKSEYLISSIWGIIIYLAIDGITYLIQPKNTASANETSSAGTKIVTTDNTTATTQSVAPIVAKAGLISFLYLEVLDMSFSLDGVIGAFAITQDIILILIGLAIGAFFVRSFTIFIVDKKILKQIEFLEHGAFWSIGILATCMLLKTIMHISELFIVGTTLLVLVASIIHSRIKSKASESVAE